MIIIQRQYSIFKYVNNIQGVRVTMDISIKKAMNVILKDGKVFKFKECGSGLYFYDIMITDKKKSVKTNSTFTSYCLLSTVTKNK